MKNELLFSFARNDFKARFAGSVFGVVWAFVQPVVTILIYWFVFQVAFGNGPVGDVPYVLWLVAGIVPWFFISEGWGSITGVLHDYSYLVKKVVFDVGRLPYIRLISAMFVHLFFVLLIFVITFCYGFSPRLIHLQIFYYMLCASGLTLGLGLFSCVLTAFFKDVGSVVGIFVQFGFWLTPIFWDIAAIPPSFAWIFKLNPVYYIVSGYRDTFVGGVWFWRHPYQTIEFWVVTGMLLWAGNRLFNRAKGHFADVL